jgi:protein required for attachment to host cells
MEIGPVEPERDRPSRINDRVGAGRHKIERRLTAHQAAEEVFLSETAVRILHLLRSEQIAHLVLCAPPRALGSLRKALPVEARGQVALSLDKDITKETPAKIDERLRDQGV